MDNPLRIAHQFIWDMLESDDEFAHLVAPKRRIKTMAYYVPQLLDTIAPADTPQVAIVLSGYQMQLDRGSNLTTADVIFQLMVQVYGLDTRVVSDILWSWMRAMLKARHNAAELGCIYNVTPGDAQIKIERTHGELATISAGTVVVSTNVSNLELLGA